MILKIKKLNSYAKLPNYVHPGDAGLDLYCDKDFILAPSEKVLISTGISMEIPENHVGLIWDKSGMAAKHTLHVLAGVVDSGYRGEIKVVMINLSKEDYKIEKHDKVAQMLIQPVQSCEIEEISETSESSRGEGGFGSTGYK